MRNSSKTTEHTIKKENVLVIIPWKSNFVEL